jgi:hypothetical protein
MRLLRKALSGRARRLVTGLVAMSLLAAGSSAAAGPLDSVLAPCGKDLSQPFLPWLDPANYAFAPNGGLEGGLGGWSSSGGARAVSGNESYAVHDTGDGYSLSLAPGASATTPSICIGTLSPAARLFVRNPGSPLSTLRVDALYTTVLGIRTSALVGVIGASASWQPTLPLPLLANAVGLPLLGGGSTQIALRFTSQGLGGSWQLDDVYVDPYKGT